jgi:formamidopyrimidine-DNA glycosylase
VPELPEVEAIRRGLTGLIGARVDAVLVRDVRGITRHDPSHGDFRQMLLGKTLIACARRGKFLWLPLEDEDAARPTALLAHMGMSGQLLVKEPEEPNERALRVRLALSLPDGTALALHFIDQRTFGSLALEPLVPASDGHPAGRGTSTMLLPRQVEHIARDPLDPHFDEDLFADRLLRRHSTVKRALLDQRLISGVGNIYADEALWGARIHFDQPTQTLGRPRAGRLLESLRDVLIRAQSADGTSFDNLYVDVNGRSGRFATHLAVYGREGLPCRRCGREVHRAHFMNRSSYFCRHCQRLR